VRLRAVIAQVDRLLAREVVGSRLTRTQVSVLFALVRQGSRRPGDLAEREGINPTLMSRVVGGLETAGLARRVPDPEDGRAVRVDATPEGVRLYEQLQRDRARLIADYVDGLSSEDGDRLLAALPVLEGLAVHLQDRAGERRR